MFHRIIEAYNKTYQPVNTTAPCLCHLFASLLSTNSWSDDASPARGRGTAVNAYEFFSTSEHLRNSLCAISYLSLQKLMPFCLNILDSKTKQHARVFYYSVHLYLLVTSAESISSACKIKHAFSPQEIVFPLRFQSLQCQYFPFLKITKINVHTLILEFWVQVDS